jgi:putative hemolysin
VHQTPRDTHVIDELLEERTQTLRKVPLLWPAIRRWCLPFFRYPEAVYWADRLAPCDAHTALRLFAEYLSLDVRVTGLQHVPRKGALLIVANHPPGFVDALAIHAALNGIRPDLQSFANRDVMRIVPEMHQLVIPIEWLRHRRTKSAMRETFESTSVAFKEERAIIIFPAGGIARGSVLGLRELDWLTATVKLIRRHACAVLPVHIHARNSWLYYVSEAIHPELRDLLRFRDVFGKRQQRFDLTIGPVIAPAEITGSPEEAICSLQAYIERDLRNSSPFCKLV